jgi:hypothetical protein
MKVLFDGLSSYLTGKKPQNSEISKWLTQKTIKQPAATLSITRQLALVQS